MTTFEWGHVSAKSVVVDDPAKLGSIEVDFALVTPSWDKRSVEVGKVSGLAAEQIAIVVLENRGTTGLRDIHDDVVHRFAQEVGDVVEEVHGASEDLDGLWSRLTDVLWDRYKEVGRPMRLFVDLTSCPRYFSIGLLGWGLFHGIVEEVGYFYAEGRYELASSEPGELFTLGRWETKAIAGLEGTYEPSLGRHFVVSVGFEGAKTYRAVSQSDPDRVSVLFPSPGVRPEYDNLVEDSNRALFDDFEVADDHVIRANGADAVDAWSKLATSRVADSEESNISYLCCGSKPHSLAMALDSLSRTGGTVLYNKPSEHRETATEPSGRYHLVRVRDLSAAL